MRSIFIAYRESDAKAWAISLRDAMAAAFGESEVFLDKDALEAGSWSEQIERAIQECRVMLIVIGKGWISARDESGQLRLHQADDVHRRELALALSRPALRMLPVRVDGAAVPRESELPEELRPLVALQSYSLADAHASRAVDSARVVNAVARITGLAPRGDALPDGSKRQATRFLLASSLLLTAGVATYFSMNSMRLGLLELVTVLLTAGGMLFTVRAVWARWKRTRFGTRRF